MIARQRCVAPRHILLNDDAATHGFERTVKNGKEAIARGFDQPSVVFRNAGLNQIALDSLDARMRPFLIELHETAVATDIPDNDGSETTRSYRTRWHTAPGRIPGGVDIANFLAHSALHPTRDDLSGGHAAKWLLRNRARRSTRGNTIELSQR